MVSKAILFASNAQGTEVASEMRKYYDGSTSVIKTSQVAKDCSENVGM